MAAADRPLAADRSRAAGRPFESGDAARQVGQATRLAAVERQEMDLGGVLAILGVRWRRVLFDDRPSIRDEGDDPAVRGEARVVVVPDPERQLACRPASPERHEPERLPVPVGAGCDRLDGDHGGSSIGGEAWLGGDPQAGQVVGAWSARQG
jgi:hypothetical protein